MMVDFLLKLFSFFLLSQDTESAFVPDTDIEFVDEALIYDSPYYQDEIIVVNNIPSVIWQKPKIEIPDDFRSDDPRIIKKKEFWLKIYTQISSDQGFIHDAEDLDVIYKVVDFSNINLRSDINKYRKQFLREKLVKLEKESIKKFLLKVKNNRLNQLSGQEKELYEKYRENFQSRSLHSLIKNLRFQLGQKDKIFAGIFYSGLYLQKFYNIFTDCKVPVVLSWLPFLESSFNPMAQSKVGASGLFQLMPSVLRKKELNCFRCDLRNQPFIAAQIACRVLRQNYARLRSWDLAVTAYNHGPTGLEKLIKRCGSKKLSDLMDKNRCGGYRLGFASRNFWPAFLSLVEIYMNAGSFYLKPTQARAWDVEIYRLTKNLTFKDIINAFDNNQDVAFLYNAHLRYWYKRPELQMPSGLIVVLPNETKIQGVRKDESKYY